MNNEPEPKVRKKRYDINFKRSAVELWLSDGKSAEAVAAELGISGQTLKTWKQQLAAPPCACTLKNVSSVFNHRRDNLYQLP